jgi:hypothetical protein
MQIITTDRNKPLGIHKLKKESDRREVEFCGNPERGKWLLCGGTKGHFFRGRI